MEIRKVQKTNDMFYLYLPTKWCKQYAIKGQSKVGVQANTDGSLGIYAQPGENELIDVRFKTKGDNPESLHKFIVACYISPANSFKIALQEGVSYTKVLNQKNLMSLELVELDGNTVTCESSVQLSDPLSMLHTMMRKVKNLVSLLSKQEHRELVERYEEEIDRSKLLIEKSIISSLVYPAQSQHKGIELHFMSLISKELERLADHLISLKNIQPAFLKRVSDAVSQLQRLLQEEYKELTTPNAMKLLDSISLLKSGQVRDLETYDLRRISRALNSISEVIMDWAIVKEIERQRNALHKPV